MRFFKFVAAIALLGFSSVPGSNADEPTCEPTEPDMLGPYYKPNAPVRGKTGSGVLIKGLVKGTNCSTIGRAQLEWWQADADGEYVDSLRATLYTNAKGQYKYETEAPGLYPSRPIRHWHVKVTAPGYEELITQVYPESADVKDVKQDFVLIPAAPSLEADADGGEDSE